MRLAFALLLTLATPTLAGQIITLPGGVPTPIPGTDLTVMLSSVTDQRCPADVTCVWQGMIMAELTVLSGVPTPTILTLCNACDQADIAQTVAGRTFAMGDLLPERDALDPLSRQITLQDYTLQVIITP